MAVRMRGGFWAMGAACVVATLGFDARAEDKTFAGDVEQRSRSRVMAAKARVSLRGRHRVGSTTIFVRDDSRSFDPWNADYGSPEYKALLAHLDEIGEPRTLVTEVWYPAGAEPTCRTAKVARERAMRCRRQTRRRATYLDYYAGERSIFDRRSVSPSLVTASGEAVSVLAARDPAAFAALEAQVLDELSERERGSFVDAKVAAGRFPLIVLSHGGFTGNVRSDARREIWTTTAESLASHGYVVMAIDHTGDARLPVVFHDGLSELQRLEGPAAVAAADEVLFAQPTVPERITSLIFQPGGWPLAHTVMRGLFEMRVDDVASVLAAARALDAGPGPLHGHIDIDRVGVAGFSLGSMTTQVAVSSLPGVVTGMGWNNGLPNAWEPPSFRGISKPIFLSLATEDELSRTFFTDIPFLVYPNAVPGGQPSDFLFLEGERFFPPTADNPEPVVRTGYDRARGEKLLLSLVDSTHWDVVDDDDFLFPRHRLAAGELAVAFDNRLLRLPVGARVLDPDFSGEPYTTLSWRSAGGGWVYRPHEIRDYYSIAWFGLYLQQDQRYRRQLAADPFGRDTLLRLRLRGTMRM